MTVAVKAFLLFVSFAGLCAGVRMIFDTDKYIAPAVAGCGVIVILMLGGMAGILLPVLIALYALGFAGAIYAYGVKRSAPDLFEIALGVLFAALLVLRFGRTKLFFNDEFSHWGLVAKHLLRFDAFPGAEAAYVKYQAYPLGSACFIYYVGRAVGASEGVYYTAQYFLHGILFLPVLSELERAGKKRLFPAAIAAFVLLIHFADRLNTVQVDGLLAFFGICAASTILFYRDEPKKLFISAVPCLMAAVAVKSGGLMIPCAAALCTLLMLRAQPEKHIGGCALMLALPVGLFVVWTLHVKTAFANGLSTKHAVSVASYIAEVKTKGAGTILAVLGVFIKKLLSPTLFKAVFLAYTAAFGVLSIMLAKRAGRTREALKRLGLGICIYAAWLVLLYCMYIVSMPTTEALTVSSFDRYNCTGQAFLMGWFTIAGLDALAGSDRKVLTGLTDACVCLCAAIVIALYFVPQAAAKYPHHLTVSDEMSRDRTVICELTDEGLLHEGGTYMYLYDADSETKDMYGMYSELFTLKYETLSANGYFLVHSLQSDEYSAATWKGEQSGISPVEFINENIGACDACVLLSDMDKASPEINGFFDSYSGDTPVYRAK